MISCKKENSVSIPIHADSYNWTMGSKTRYFVNGVGDSIKTDSVVYSNAFEPISKNGFNYEYGFYFEIVTLDTILSITNFLRAKIKDNVREDFFSIEGVLPQTLESVYTFGIAANANVLDSATTNYHDTLILNNTIYTNLYSTNTNNKLTLFVSPKYSLVGFALENDTFNLVN